MASAASPDEAAKRRALAEAAEWFAEWQAGELSATERQRWQAWRDANDTHRWAWQQVEGVSRRFTEHLDEDERQTADSVISTARQRRQGRRHLFGGLVTLALVSVLTAALWQSTPLPRLVQQWGADYHTATGEVTRIVLEDGTQVWLSSASALNVDYDQNQRRLALVTGEVLIETGKDAERPFYLDTRSARLTPLGTRFSVGEQPSGELLAVFDGAVAIKTLGDAQHTSQRQVVTAGQQAHYAADRIGELTPAEGRREAWANGILLAESMSLKAFAATLSRHHRGRLEVDPSVADLTLLGAFPLDDLERTLNMVETTLPVKVRRVMPWWLKIEAGEASSSEE
ncbi:FecR domain-containing protein [Vreelandella salicampi]|uniref:FecR domain-containing protein n=1 Tax=Vreelandella salicampi TaxID=1449798 RepID=A0A7Z0LPB4_9GAMM|nr:FecR domain-containing protein [Halomonas salicampi]NYS62584.1 FecR domain-containing protein [Halomonas salicampi]